jgi:flagellar protein FliT
VNLLGCYGQLASIVTRMLEAARAAQWTELPALDAQCTAAARRLQATHAPGMSAWEWALIRALDSRIRADQDALNALVRPQFMELVARLEELERSS